MSNTVGPVDIEFVLKNVNFEAQAKKMKDEISGVTDTVQKEAAKMTASMGDFANQSAKDMKASIAVQKQVIKDLQQSIKELQNTASNSTGRNKIDATSALGLAKKDLIAEQGALLNMQKELTRAKGASTVANVAEEKSQTSLIGSLGKWAIGLASVAAAMKIGKEIINSTKDGMDRFDFAVAGAEEGLSYFYKTLATGDWTDFFANMEKAIRAGHAYAEAMDEVKEAIWGLSMIEADMLKENTQLEIDLRNTDLPKDIRLAQGQKRIENEEFLSKRRIAIAEKELTAAVAIAEERSKIDTDNFDATKRETYEQNQLLKTLKQVSATTKAEAEEYNKTRAIFKNLGITDAAIQRSVDPTAMAFKETSPEVKLYADALIGKGKLKEEMLINVIEAYKKVGQADDSALSGLKRVFTTVNGIKKEIKEGEAEANKKAREAAEIENQIKATKEAMNKANGKELDDLAAKLTLLEKELKLRHDIINAALLKARDPETEAAAQANQQITSIGIKPIAKVGQTRFFDGAMQELVEIDKKGNAIWKNRKLETSELNKFVKDKNKDAAKDQEKLDEDAATRKERIWNSVFNGAQQITAELMKQGALSEAEGKVIGDALGAIATGDPIAMAAQAVSMIISMFPQTAAAKYAEQIEAINQALRDQQRLIDQAGRTGGEADKRRDEIKILQEKKSATEAALVAAQKKLDNKIFDVGPVYWDRVHKVRELTQAVKDVQNEIDDADQALTDFLVGGFTQNTIADVIAQGFKDGKTSVDDFADYMNEALLNAVMDIFKAEILGPQIDDLTIYIKEALADKKLTEAEKQEIDRRTKAIADQTDPLWNNLTGALDLPNSAASASSAAKGVSASATEDSVSAMVGQLMAVRVDIKDILKTMASGQDDASKNLLYMKEVAENSRYLPRLKAIEEGIGEMNRTLKEKL
ncbi:MAG TPA: hypothetical protein DCR40_18010 [Prolixibacteraceae bacterium]|nr:hypothetical protein [Prolixibacteraceae bacterium]